VNRIALVAIALGLMLIAGCSKTSTEKPLTPVTVRAAERYSTEEGLRYSANVEAYTSVNLAFKASGYVTEILQVRGADGRMRNVQDGDLVKKGALLAQLRQTEFLDRVTEARARLAASAAEVEKATLDYERAKTLYAAQSLTKPDYDTANARFAEAQARQQGAGAALQQAQVELHDSSLRAPNDGVLLKRGIEIGALVNPGTLAFVLADTRSVKVVFAIPDLMLSQARLGGTLKISTESMGIEEMSGRVTRVSPAADPQTRLFDVELTIPNSGGRLKPGMIASLHMPHTRAPELATVVPLSSVVTSKAEKSSYAVYVVEESGNTATARLRTVKLGETYGNTIAVREGVLPGERVVASGTMMLNDGDKVRVVPQVVPR
jgi:RND family efflux transporter MFP subunit